MAYAVLLILVFASCSRIDEIDINDFGGMGSEALQGRVAVFGNVTTEMRQHSVTFTPVKQWNENLSPLPDINRVFVVCGNDTIPYREQQVGEFAPNAHGKTFVSEQPFKGEVGKTYQLVVETPAGDTNDQNLILIDEAPIYNPSHLFGMISIFNPEAVNQVTLYKSNMPAQYGGRVSAVLDCKMKEGNMNSRFFGRAESLRRHFDRQRSNRQGAGFLPDFGASEFLRLVRGTQQRHASGPDFL